MVIQANEDEKREWQDMRLALEEKLLDAQNLNQSLQSEIAKVKADNEATERNMEQQLEEQRNSYEDRIERLQKENQELAASGPNNNIARNSSASGGAEVDELLARNQQLEQELREQEEVTEEVRKEAMEFLDQMKQLSQDSEQAWKREEELMDKIKKLQDENADWRSRYAKVKSQIRSIRAMSIGLPLQPQPGLLTNNSELADPNGLVRDVDVTKYQIAIDDLLRAGRGADPASVLNYMKAVIRSVQGITQGMEDSAVNSPADGTSTGETRMRLKTRVSATANNLITASKNHATANGLSPVSLLDAAASHLTTEVVELIKLVKVRPTPPGEAEDEGPDPNDFSSRLSIDPKFDPSQFPHPPNTPPGASRQLNKSNHGYASSIASTATSGGMKAGHTAPILTHADSSSNLSSTNSTVVGTTARVGDNNVLHTPVESSSSISSTSATSNHHDAGSIAPFSPPPSSSYSATTVASTPNSSTYNFSSDTRGRYSNDSIYSSMSSPITRESRPNSGAIGMGGSGRGGDQQHGGGNGNGDRWVQQGGRKGSFGSINEGVMNNNNNFYSNNNYNSNYNNNYNSNNHNEATTQNGNRQSNLSHSSTSTLSHSKPPAFGIRTSTGNVEDLRVSPSSFFSFFSPLTPPRPSSKPNSSTS